MACQCSKRTLKRLEEELISQERNATSNYSTDCVDSSFISSATSNILSCSEVEETYSSFQNPESFNEFDNADDKNQVDHVHGEMLPQNEYESVGKYFDTHRMIFYIKVFNKVIEMESFSKFLTKLLKIGLACVMHLNIAGNTWLKLGLIVHNINCSFELKLGMTRKT